MYEECRSESGSPKLSRHYFKCIRARFPAAGSDLKSCLFHSGQKLISGMLAIFLSRIDAAIGRVPGTQYE